MDLLKSVCGLLVHLMMVGFVSGNVVLMGTNVSRSFDDLEADFTPKIKGSGESGVLYLAEPLDACSPLTNKVIDGSKYSFALIIRGRCSFDDKVRSAQNAGFRAAIIYDFEDNAPLVAMGGTRHGIKIYAVFVSKASAKVLQQYAGCTDVELWVLPIYVGSPWSIMAVSFISLLAITAALAMCFFVHRHHGRRERLRAPQVAEFHGMSRHLVKAMPSLTFTTVLDENCTSRTCAICLEDYNTGEKLRILPCLHKFHVMCVDSWLTTWRTFCPVCKRDARAILNIPPASESTPLLSAVPPPPSLTATLLSCHSSLAASPSIPIVPTPPRYPTASLTHSLSNSHHMSNLYRSYNNSPSLRNVPSQRSQTPHLISPRPIGLPMSSSHSSRYMHPYNPSSSNSSPSYLAGSSSNRHLLSPHSIGLPMPFPYGSRYMQPYDRSSSIASPNYLVGSSGKHSYLQHCESGVSTSTLVSSHTLPSC